MNTPGTSVSGYVLLFTIQFLFLVIFGVYTDYDDNLKPKNGTQSEEGFIIPKYARKDDWFMHHGMLSCFYSQQTSKIFT